MSLMLDWDESFSMQANVTSAGPQRVVLRGYVTERRPDGLYAASLLPQLFYGADGNQLTSWRQYVSGTGSQTILSRSGGQPSIPKEELFWRRVGNTVGAVKPGVGVYSVGRRMPGSLMPISQSELSVGETVKGNFYELHIDTDGIPDPNSAVNALMVGLRNQGVEAVWASADAKKIRIQIAGSPTSWPIILSLLPQILSLMGISVILISVYFVFAVIPGWVWGLLAIGIMFLTIVPAILVPKKRGR